MHTAHIIGDNNYSLIKNDSTYYMVESSCDKDISLLSRGTNECAVFTLQAMIQIPHCFSAINQPLSSER